jgi:uncharacterized protein YjbJ (UPF0337 family)
VANPEDIDADQGHDTGSGDTGKKLKGEVKEVLGAVTGDRQVEAKGRVEKRVADPAAPEDHETGEEVGRQVDEVRRTHHDLPAGGGEHDGEGPLGT